MTIHSNIDDWTGNALIEQARIDHAAHYGGPAPYPMDPYRSYYEAREAFAKDRPHLAAAAIADFGFNTRFSL